ncbi:unnamed protein product [Cyprideis torosa]|uniref:Uncharacterized protein n=1 Tax=Cyprideis torosa TaxID=163714 RepID=A0A7R8ZM79_9CRUS|nr:unnamed protein product [Cyprideis torosa]CAG0888272.1 unnamed protein product [Cyprideis torosa]
MRTLLEADSNPETSLLLPKFKKLLPDAPSVKRVIYIEPQLPQALPSELPDSVKYIRFSDVMKNGMSSDEVMSCTPGYTPNIDPLLNDGDTLILGDFNATNYGAHLSRMLEETETTSHTPSTTRTLESSTITLPQGYHQMVGNANRFRSLASYAGFPFSEDKKSTFHIEGWAGLIGSVGFLTGEFIVGAGEMNPTDAWIDPDNVDHTVMITLFMLRSLSVLLCHNGKLPRKSEFIATGLSGILQTPMFLAHAYGKHTISDAVLHGATAILFFLFGWFAIFEMQHPNRVMAGVGKSFFVCLLGVFMAQTGDLLMFVEPFKGNHMFMDIRSQIFYLMMYLILDALIVAAVFTGIAVWVKTNYFPEKLNPSRKSMDGKSQILYLMIYFILDALIVAVVVSGIAVRIKIHHFPQVYEKQKDCVYRTE